MNVISLLLNLFFFFPPSHSNDITIKITGLKEKKGELLMAIYNQAEGYMIPEKAFLTHRTKVNGQKEASIVLKNIKNGRYAFLVFLDENGNEEIDTNMFGIPKEKYGFSGNIEPLFRAPYFEEAAIQIDSSVKVVKIELN